MAKVNFWHRVFPGHYRIGNIDVRQIWETEGVCAGTHMWHVEVDGKTVIAWAYLRNAKISAHEIDDRKICEI